MSTPEPNSETEKRHFRLGGRELYKRLLAYVKPYRKVFIIAIIGMILLAATEPLLPALLKSLLDGSFVEKDPASIRLMPILLIVLFIFRGVFGFISNVSIQWIATRIVMDVRTDMFDRIVNLPNRYYDTHATGNIISKLTYNVNQVTNACTSSLVILVKDSFTIIGLLAWMFYLDWKMSLIFFLILPVAGLLVKIVSNRLRRLSRTLQENIGDLTHVIEESINGNKVIKIFGGQTYEKNRFHEINNRVRRFTLKFFTTSAFNTPLMELIVAIALAFIIYMASLSSVQGTLTVGGFISFFTAMALLFSPTKRLTRVNEQIQMAIAAAESIFALIDETPEPDMGTKHIERARGNIQFKQVNYYYADTEHPALLDINLDVQAGETIALVGQSGSGKTTLVNMIPRFYLPTAGEILLDGVNIKDIALSALRANLALVSQEVILFDDTVANNIAYGTRQEKFSEADIINAAKAAHALEFIEAMPEGLQTQVGENGVRLSGGQRQRLAIARAILKDAPVLILDEATSALDTQSEKHVQEALENLKRGRTTIIIAHRLSTIKNADRIIVLDKGRVAEVGTHESLVEKGGIYNKLQQLQSF
jgi:subfamily B ATP-binding cassette protein MsbA